jgi:hypothetical protein
MRRTGVMAKRWIVRLVLAATLWAAMLGLSSAPVGATCPAPGTGLAGAHNMAADATMHYTMVTHTGPEGVEGMKTAVGNAPC